MSKDNQENYKFEEIPISKIVVGKAQVRTDLTSGIDDLVLNIGKHGLLQPIRVAERGDGKYEVIAGQRRVIACSKLGWDTIPALVEDDAELDEWAKMAKSISENVIRKDNSSKELIDACTKLYKRYGSMKMVAEELGIKADVVSRYVKYDQLVEPLKQMVDENKLDMKVALQAQKGAMNGDGAVDEEAAVKFAQELTPLGNKQRDSFVKAVTEDPTASIEEKIEKGRKQPVLKQIVVTLEDSMHMGLNSYAKDEGVNMDEAASLLIEDGLVRRGLVED